MSMERGSLLALAKGMWVTLKHILLRPSVTVQYPEEKRTPSERFHGRHMLNRYPDGMEKCIGCELCAGACPADAILVWGQENPPADPVSPGERYAAVYEINFLRCIFCGLCIEACPTEAITMTTFFEFSGETRDSLIYTKDELLRPPPEAEREKFGYTGTPAMRPLPGPTATFGRDPVVTRGKVIAATENVPTPIAGPVDE